MIKPEERIRELDHQLTHSVLRYQYIPDHISSLVDYSFYTNYSISIGTSDFITNPVVVEKGVLQGDTLSLFLTCVSIH